MKLINLVIWGLCQQTKLIACYRRHILDLKNIPSPLKDNCVDVTLNPLVTGAPLWVLWCSENSAKCCIQNEVMRRLGYFQFWAFKLSIFSAIIYRYRQLLHYLFDIFLFFLVSMEYFKKCFVSVRLTLESVLQK